MALNFDFSKTRYLTVSDCAFTLKEGSSGNFLAYQIGEGQTVDKKPLLKNCFFGSNYADLSHNWITYEGVNSYTNPTLNKVAHYIVEGYCEGEVNDYAIGCKNNSCIDDKGCGEDAFKFPPDEPSYTEMHHDDVDTPTPSPSIEFSQSIDFTYSFQFTFSHKFSDSSKFSFSNYFTKTSDFTKTTDFSNSNYFSKSTFFTKSDDFSKSVFFSNSKIFTYTKKADTTNSIVTQNPLNELMIDDDPFESEFDIYN